VLAYLSTLLRVYALDDVAVAQFDTRVRFGQLLRESRFKAGMTQSDLAQQLGVQQQAVNRWENDRDRPRPEHVKVIAKIFGLSAQEVGESLGYLDVLPVDEDATETLRLPAGVKLTKRQRKALNAMLDAFLEDIERMADED
jgi:transcriptional regulator with XRE-family HTH domain